MEAARSEQPWANTGRIGPFNVHSKNKINPKYDLLIQCFAQNDDERDLIQFHPLDGLLFTPQNFTKEEYIHFSTTTTSKHIPISCETTQVPAQRAAAKLKAPTPTESKDRCDVDGMDAEQCRRTSGSDGSDSSHAVHHDIQTQSSGKNPWGTLERDGLNSSHHVDYDFTIISTLPGIVPYTLNASQVVFLLLAVSILAYYLYKMNIHVVKGCENKRRYKRTDKQSSNTASSRRRKGKQHGRRKTKGRVNAGAIGIKRIHTGSPSHFAGFVNNSIISSSKEEQDVHEVHDLDSSLDSISGPNIGGNEGFGKPSSHVPAVLRTTGNQPCTRAQVENVKTQTACIPDETKSTAVQKGVEADGEQENSISDAGSDGNDGFGKPSSHVPAMPMVTENQPCKRSKVEYVKTETAGIPCESKCVATQTGTEENVTKSSKSGSVEELSHENPGERNSRSELGEHYRPTFSDKDEAESSVECNSFSQAQKEKPQDPSSESSTPTLEENTQQCMISTKLDSKPSVDTTNASQNSIVLFIKGMTCGGCVKVVDRVLNSFDEVNSTNTDLVSCTSTVYYSVSRLNLLPMLMALDDVGMGTFLESLTRVSTSSSAKSNKSPLDCNQSAGKVGVTTHPKQIGIIGEPRLSSPLSLMDELRVGTTPLRRYQCSCGCEGCICSDRQVHGNDTGVDVTLADLCQRLQGTLGTTDLEATFRDGGGDKELRDKLSNATFPCGCDL